MRKGWASAGKETTELITGPKDIRDSTGDAGVAYKAEVKSVLAILGEAATALAEARPDIKGLPKKAVPPKGPGDPSIANSPTPFLQMGRGQTDMLPLWDFQNREARQVSQDFLRGRLQAH